MYFHKDEEPGKSKKLVTFAIVIMMVTIIFFQMIDTSVERLTGDDEDTDGLHDDLETGVQDDSWTHAAGTMYGTRTQETIIPSINNEPNFLWGKVFTEGVIQTMPLFYDKGVFFTTYDDEEESSTIYYLTENVGHVIWSRTFENTKVQDILIDDSTESLVVFYEDKYDDIDETKLLTFSIESPLDESQMVYWPCLPGDDTVSHDINLEGSTNELTELSYANHPICYDGEIYFVAELSTIPYFIGVSLDNIHYELDDDYRTKTIANITAQTALSDYGILDVNIWKLIACEPGNFYLGVNNEAEDSENGVVFALNAMGTITSLYIPDPAAMVSDLIYIKGISPDQDRIVVLFDDKIRVFNPSLVQLDNYNVLSDVDQSCEITLGIPTLSWIPTTPAEPTVFVVLSTYVYGAGSQQPPGEFTYKQILWYDLNITDYINYNTTTSIDTDIAWNLPLLSVNNFVGVAGGLYTLNKDESGDEYLVLFDTSESGTEYSIVYDTPGFILGNGKMILNTCVYNSTTSTYYPSLKCYGGWSTSNTSWDSDGDGIRDGTIDLDEDGDYEGNEIGEIVNETLANAKGYGTDPGREDTDGDSLDDKEELLDGWNITGTSITVYSDPFDVDTDDDNLGDYFEWYFGLDPEYYTTDNDELTDYGEIFSYWTMKRNYDIDLKVSQVGNVQYENYTFKQNGDSEYGGSYWIKYNGQFSIIEDSYCTGVDIIEAIRDSYNLVNNSNLVDDSDETNVYCGVFIDTIDEIQTNSHYYNGSYYYSYHFDIPTNPDTTLWVNSSCISNNDFSGTNEFLSINSSILQRRGLISEYYSLEESNQLNYSSCDIDDDDLYDGPLDGDSDGDGISDLYEFELGSSPLDDAGDYDNDGISDADEVSKVYGLKDVNIALGKTAGTNVTIDDQKRITGIELASYYYTRTGISYTNGPSALLDGNTSTYWFSESPAITNKAPMIIIDLQHYSYVSSIRLIGNEPNGDHNPDDFDIKCYSGHFWKTAYCTDITLNTNYSISESGNYYDVEISFDPFWTRYLEINFTSSTTPHSNIMIRELEVYGPSFTLPGRKDTDNDGLDDKDEIDYGGGGTNALTPVDSDTDDDGLPDGWIDGWDYHPITGWFLNFTKIDTVMDPWEGEDINTNSQKDTFTYQQSPESETDPNDADTDNDGMPDGWERYYEFDPNLASDANQDFDSDSLTNLREYILGTNPVDDDSDNDGLEDGDEFQDIKFRTSVDDGILSSDSFLEAEVNDWIMYDPTTLISAGEELYLYETTHRDVKLDEYPATSDLFTLGLWDFDDQNASFAFDASECNNDLTIVGADKVSGRLSGGIEFNGTTDYLWCEDDVTLRPKEALTISLWINPDVITGTRIIVQKENSYYLKLTTGNIRGGIYIGSQHKYVDGTISADNWHHVALVYDGTYLTMYIDGIKDHQISASGDIDAVDNSNLYVGGSTLGYFDGTIDDLQISNIPRPHSNYRMFHDAQWNFNSISRKMEDNGNNNIFAYAGTEIAKESNDPTNTSDGIIDDAIFFDGTDDCVVIGESDILNFYKTMTIEAWIQPQDATVNTVMPIFFKDTVFSLSLKADGSGSFSLSAIGWEDTDEYSVTTASIIDHSTWYHIALVINESNVMSILVNGIEVGSYNLPGEIDRDARDIYLGGNGTSDYFHGAIDEVRLSRSPYPTFFGDDELPNVQIIGYLEDGSKILKTDFEDDDYDRLYVREAPIEWGEESSESILQGLTFEFVRDDTNQSVPMNDAKSDSPVLLYRLQEWFVGDPLGTDTDKDGILDGNESSPYVDTDSDGFINMDDQDSDDDGLTDYKEDLDKDGIFDTSAGEEIREPSPIDADSDNDGILDGEEYRLLTSFSPERNADESFDSDLDGDTDFYDLDSDNDGITDASEYGNNDYYDLGEETCPVNPDTDGDGLLDNANVSVSDSDQIDFWKNLGFAYVQEGQTYIFIGEDYHGTNALDDDTDDDGLDDGLEYVDYSWWFDTNSGTGDIEHDIITVDPGSYVYYVKARSIGANPVFNLIVKNDITQSVLDQENLTSKLNSTENADSEGIKGGYHWYSMSLILTGETPYTIGLFTNSVDVRISRGVFVKDGLITNGSLKYGGSYASSHTLFASGGGNKQVELDLTLIRDGVEYRVKEGLVNIELHNPYLNFSSLNVDSGQQSYWISDGFEGGSNFSVDLASAINEYQAHQGTESILFPLHFYSNGSVSNSGAINVSIDEIRIEPILSDPLNHDTDEDNITDSKERNYYLTSPIQRDTDDDGIQDGVELNDLHGERKDNTIEDILYDSSGTVVSSSDSIVSGATYYLHIPKDDGLIGTLNLTNMSTEHGGHIFWENYSYELPAYYSQTDKALYSADFDMDGWADYVGYASDGLIVAYGKDGEIIDEDKTSISSITSIDMGDINRDGYMDALVTTSSNTYSCLNDEGDGFVSTSHNEYSGTKYGALGELNGDGYLDMVFAHTARDEIVTRFYDTEYECFDTKKTYTLNDPTIITSSDFDHDGYADIAVFNYQDSSYGLTILLNDGDGTLAQVSGWGKSFIAFDHTSYEQITTGDLNNDGWDEIIITHPSDDNITILWNEKGEFVYSNATMIEISGPNYVDIADLDVDGWNELIVSNMTHIVINPDPLEIYKKQYITVFKNNRNCTFTTKIILDGVEDEDAGAVVAADFDGDGSLDIVFLRDNSVITESRITLKHVEFATMNLTTAYGYVSVLLNLKNDIYNDYLINITSTGTDDQGIPQNLAKKINAYLYTMDTRIDHFTENLITADSIKIPVTFCFTGNGNLKIKETRVDLASISTDPGNADSDWDRVNDGNELFAENSTTQTGGAYPTLTNPLETDTDADSLSDGREDANYNGLVDWTDYNNDDFLNDGGRLSWSTDFSNETTENDDLNNNSYSNEIITELIETDPLDQDSDEDGITENEEVRGFQTDPLLLDSDHDMIFDGTEVGRYVNTLAGIYFIPQDTHYDCGAMAHDGDATNGDQYVYGDHDSANKPTIPTNLDSDEDDLYDGFDDNDNDRCYDSGTETGEDLNGNGRIDWSIGESDPMNPDTDDDGIKDGDEKNGVTGYYTSKYDADTDDDGLSDYAEIFIHGTNPTKPDTDGDMLSDGLELGVQTGVWTANVANGENQNRYPLNNGNFESGAAFWTCEPNHSVISSIQYSHTGFQCLRAIGEGNTSQNALMVSMERLYRISGYIRKGDANDTTTLTITDQAGISTLLSLDLDVDDEDTYIFWKGYFDTAMNPMVNLNLYTANAEYVYIDNLCLDKVVNNTDNSNGNFTTDTDPYTTTKPTDPDSDGDMIYDGWFDANSNGIFDSNEYGEDVNRNGEVDIGNWSATGETDPKSKDTDEDEMPDNWEQNFNGYNGSNPIPIWLGSVNFGYLNPLIDDASSDNDNDTISNINEYKFPIVSGYYLNPSNQDSDGDTMLEEWEFIYVPSLNPLISDGNIDFDNDGIINVNEYNLMGSSTNDGRLDPTDQDTDDDDIIDGKETYSTSFVFNGEYIYSSYHFLGTENIFWYQDLDSDGLINALDSDSDGDNIFDGKELNGYQVDVNLRSSEGRRYSELMDLYPRTNSNPNHIGTDGLDVTDHKNTVLDSDRDYLPDYKELNPKMYYETVTNYLTEREISIQFNPLVADSIPPKIKNLKIDHFVEYSTVQLVPYPVVTPTQVWMQVEGDIIDVSGVGYVEITVEYGDSEWIDGGEEQIFHFSTSQKSLEIPVENWIFGVCTISITVKDRMGNPTFIEHEKAGVVKSLINLFMDFMNHIYKKALSVANAIKNALIEKIWSRVEGKIMELLDPHIASIQLMMYPFGLLIKNLVLNIEKFYLGEIEFPDISSLLSSIVDHSLFRLVMMIPIIYQIINMYMLISSMGITSLITNLATGYITNLIISSIFASALSGDVKLNNNCNYFTIFGELIGKIDLPTISSADMYLLITAIISMFLSNEIRLAVQSNSKNVLGNYISERIQQSKDIVCVLSKCTAPSTSIFSSSDTFSERYTKIEDETTISDDEFQKKATVGQLDPNLAQSNKLAGLGLLFGLISVILAYFDDPIYNYSDRQKGILFGLSLGMGVGGLATSYYATKDLFGLVTSMKSLAKIGMGLGVLGIASTLIKAYYMERN